MKHLNIIKENRVRQFLLKSLEHYSPLEAKTITDRVIDNLYAKRDSYENKLDKAFNKTYSVIGASSIINGFHWVKSIEADTMGEEEARMYWNTIFESVSNNDMSKMRELKSHWNDIAFGTNVSAFFNGEGMTLVEWINTFENPIKSQLMYRFYELRGSDPYGCSIWAHKDYFDSVKINYITQLRKELKLDKSIQGIEYWKYVFESFEYMEEFYGEKLDAERRERLRQAQEIERQRVEANKLTFSDSFKIMLGEIYNTSEVAKILLRNENHSREFGNYITMRGELASYLPKGREHKVNDSGRWIRDGRQDAKVGKLVKKLLNEEALKSLTDADFEKFTNVVKSYISVVGDEDGEGRKIEFKVVTGDDIKTYYHEDNYSKILGTESNLWGSCMRYDSCQKYLSIYTHNTKVCSLLVALDISGKVLGRALLWVNTDNNKMMDTIYAHESLYPAFKKYAIDNEYWYKSSQSCHHEEYDMFNALENKKYDIVSVQLEKADFKYYPYLDTMKYLTDDNRLTNEEDSDFKKLCNTDGTIEDENDGQVYSEYHDESIDEDDAIHLDYTRPNGRRICTFVRYDDCVDTLHDGYRLTDDCTRVNGDWYLEDDMRLVTDIEGDYQLLDDCTFCEIENEYILTENTTQLEDGTYCHEDDAIECEHSKKYYHKDKIIFIDGVAICCDFQEEYELSLTKETN